MAHANRGVGRGIGDLREVGVGLNKLKEQLLISFKDQMELR